MYFVDTIVKSCHRHNLSEDCACGHWYWEVRHLLKKEEVFKPMKDRISPSSLFM